jgi:hypothetical protein
MYCGDESETQVVHRVLATNFFGGIVYGCTTKVTAKKGRWMSTCHMVIVFLQICCSWWNSIAFLTNQWHITLHSTHMHTHTHRIITVSLTSHSAVKSQMVAFIYACVCMCIECVGPLFSHYSFATQLWKRPPTELAELPVWPTTSPSPLCEKWMCVQMKYIQCPLYNRTPTQRPFAS